jgi:hypothetical protein
VLLSVVHLKRSAKCQSLVESFTAGFSSGASKFATFPICTKHDKPPGLLKMSFESADFYNCWLESVSRPERGKFRHKVTQFL